MVNESEMLRLIYVDDVVPDISVKGNSSWTRSAI